MIDDTVSMAVPAGLSGRKVRVLLGATHLEVLAGGRVVARHERYRPTISYGDTTWFPSRREPDATPPTSTPSLTASPPRNQHARRGVTATEYVTAIACQTT